MNFNDLKLSEDDRVNLKEMAQEHSKVIAKVLVKLCELQEQQLLKVHYSDTKKLGEEAAKIDGARKLSAEFNRLLAETRKSPT